MIFGINFSDDLIHISGLPVLISRYKYPNSIQNPKSWKITLTYQALSQTFENMGGGQNFKNSYLNIPWGGYSLLSLFHSLYLDMLNNFCFHNYAQKSLSHSFNSSTVATFTTFTSFTLSFTLSQHDEQLLFSCLCSKVAVF